MGCGKSKVQVVEPQVQALQTFAPSLIETQATSTTAKSAKSSASSLAQDSEKQALLEQGGVNQSMSVVDGAAAAATAVVSALGETATSRTMPDSDRMIAYCKGLKDLPDDSLVVQGLRFLLKYGLKPLILIFMFYVWLGKMLYKVYEMLPHNVLSGIFGIGLCFFGGTYFATFAAVEAAINLGGPDLWRHLTAVWEEGTKVASASMEDDKVDADQNNTADVDEMGWNEYVSHKAMVAMVAVEDPAQLNEALTALFTVWVTVLATLKLQFARTIAIALGLSNMLLPAMTKLIAPLLAGILGKDLCHWAPTIIDSAVKLAVIIFASFIQETISGYYSALRGAKLFALALLNVASEKGLMDQLPASFADKPFNPDNSYLDECLAYPLAAIGFYYQFSRLFAAPDFPYSILVLPVTIVEWVLRFEIYT